MLTLLRDNSNLNKLSLQVEVGVRYLESDHKKYVSRQNAKFVADRDRGPLRETPLSSCRETTDFVEV
jgi:hypothetical protein